MRSPTLPLILSLFLVACSRETAKVRATAPVKPADMGAPGNANPGSVKPADDSQDLVRQLRDPDLLNQLDDPTQNTSRRPASALDLNKRVVIKGVDSTPAPIPDSRPVPRPPMDQPVLPGTNDTSLPKSPGSGN
jgi:hypothetical protein